MVCVRRAISKPKIETRMFAEAIAHRFERFSGDIIIYNFGGKKGKGGGGWGVMANTASAVVVRSLAPLSKMASEVIVVGRGGCVCVCVCSC